MTFSVAMLHSVNCRFKAVIAHLIVDCVCGAVNTQYCFLVVVEYSISPLWCAIAVRFVFVHQYVYPLIQLGDKWTTLIGLANFVSFIGKVFSADDG